LILYGDDELVAPLTRTARNADVPRAGQADRIAQHPGLPLAGRRTAAGRLARSIERQAEAGIGGHDQANGDDLPGLDAERVPVFVVALTAAQGLAQVGGVGARLDEHSLLAEIGIGQASGARAACSPCCAGLTGGACSASRAGCAAPCD